MDQTERNRVITSFRKKEIDIMVATDVAGMIINRYPYYVLLTVISFLVMIYVYILPICCVHTVAS